MLRKIDIGEDKNFFQPDPRAADKPQLAFLADDLLKTADDTVAEARKRDWERWINSEPLLTALVDDEGKAYLFFISENIKNKVVLLDIWDYTLLPCRRSLSYTQEWHRRYASAGLVTIGIHAPFFEFGKDKKFISDACRDLGIAYPVVLDNNYEIWRSLENRYWPRKILLDHTGKAHLDYFGEGNYGEFETNIQLLLRGLSPGLPCPPLMKPVRKADEEGFKAGDTTEEIFIGLKNKVKFGTLKSPTVAGDEVHYKDESNGSYAPATLYPDGPWVATNDSMYGAVTNKGLIKMTVNFTGTDVFMVARSKAKNPLDTPQTVRPHILIDKKPIADEKFGADMGYNEYRRTVVSIKDAKLYRMVSKLDYGSHDLTVQIETETADTLEIFGFFFEDRR